jgi:cellulose synthase/poly-beta-1,6-N-acetylglucosamine synthase-like glycosyltransferase
MIIEIVTLLVLLLIFYYSYFLLGILKGLRQLIRQSTGETYDKIPGEFVSVIIPFRNETENILNSLQSMEELDYPKDRFEVIYVNDFSDDNSVEILCRARKSDNIKVLSVPEGYSKYEHKKRAIRYGLECSRGEIIVTTDADCVHSPKWLKTLLSKFDAETGFVSGPVEFSEQGTFFSRLQKLEFSGLVLTGAGLIGIGQPLICNAANIAYRKRVFDEVSGFEYKHSLSSGDDELLMQKIKKETSWKIKFCMNKLAIVETSPNRTLNQFYNQRKRWASKGLFYSNKLLILKLILIFLYYLSFPLLLVLGLFISPLFLIMMSCSLLIKALLEFLVIKTGAAKLFREDIMGPFIIAEILHIPYIIIAGISGVFGNYTWKERKIKR